MVQIILTLIILLAGIAQAQLAATPSGMTPGSLKTCVYYDQVEADPKYKLGYLYAIMTQNLLGHFLEVEPVLSAAKDYRKGQLSACDRAIYIGSYYDAKLSEDFLSDVVSYENQFLWISYNIWQLQRFLGENQFQNLTGFRFQTLVQFTDAPSPDNRQPGFFQHFHYKGEVFSKLSIYRPDTRSVVTSPEIAIVQNQSAQVLSQAEHNKSGQRTPYILRKNNFFYMGDVPYSFIHEADRYLIMTDLLFDVLNLPPRSPKRYALARIEDIHPQYDLDLMYNVIGTFRRHQIPFAISVIPNYVDPFGYRAGKDEFVTMAQKPQFLKMLRFAERNGASMILHGVTHQIDRRINCDTGSSGDDFEFWDGCKVAPLDIATEPWIRNRLAHGIKQMNEAGLRIAAWLPPHYEASPLAYKIFGETFSRSVQRVRYIPVNVDASVDKINWAGQFFPYTIYKDYYGQFLWPENLGNVRIPHSRDLDIKDHDHNLRFPEEIISSAKRNRVLRDSWASFFWHPQLIATESGIQSLDRIIREIKSYGYEFVSLKEMQDPAGHAVKTK